MRQAFYTIVLLLFVFSVGAWGQSREQLKAQAEAQLRQLSPEEIQSRLQEYGISMEEATRRASEFNVSLEEFLSRSKVSAQPTAIEPAPKRSESVKAVFPTFGTTPAGRAQPRGDTIPGFEGRIPFSLAPFGYDVFRLAPSTFEPVLNVPTPVSYELGPGDEIALTMWGETKLNYQLSVNREGNLIVPEVGPVSANGMTIQRFREKLLSRMSTVYSGLRSGAANANTFLDVSLGKLRTIQVYVLGEVTNPGGYSLSSMATAFQALYLSGGPTLRGSLRNVSVIRGKDVMTSLDFYDYLVRGDRSRDPRLQDGDIVFVNRVDRRVALLGKVLRPAVYELHAGQTLGELVALAGGVSFDAFTDRIHIERIVPFDLRKLFERNILDIDVRFESVAQLMGSGLVPEDGDVVTVRRISDLPQSRVTIVGNVTNEGRYEWRPGMRVGDALRAADSLKPNTFMERGSIFRVLPNLRREVIAFNPRRAFAGDSVENVLLKNEDELHLYTESQFFPEHMAYVWGAVRAPGSYPRNEKMSVADLVVLAGGLREDAVYSGWELSRMETTKVGVFSKVMKLSVGREFWTDSSAGTLLSDLDVLNIPSDPRYSTPRTIRVSGYVMYPGTYTIRYEGERITDILARAGGLRPGAYLEGSRYFRRLNGAGQIPIDFDQAIADPTSESNIAIKDGDSLSIAQIENVVYIRGEVFTPMAVLHEAGGSLAHYLQQAGGLKESADEDRVFVILPNGRKWEPGWFIVPDPDILPGSIIHVPAVPEKEDNSLPVLRDWATIALSIATMAVALVQVTR